LLTSPLHIPRKDIIAFISGLKASPFVEVIHIDPRLDEKAWQLFSKRRDKDWSLVDCASFVVMQERSMTEAMTTDHHFEQAGFICLLKP
ncbi:MAG: VapC toxin family PIN domain ribonuclease, partial [candidate division KSB1 bacterium]